MKQSDLLKVNGYSTDEQYPIQNSNLEALKFEPFDLKYSPKTSNPSNKEIEPQRPDYMDSLKAEFLTEHTIGATVYNAVNGNLDFFKNQEKTDYNFMNDLPNNELGDFEHYLDVNSKEQFDARRQKISKERALRTTLQNTSTPTRIFNSLLVGVTDPVNWLPIGEASAAIKAGKYIKGIGIAAAGTGVSQAISEGVLQSQQELRTKEESAYNIAGATLLGGLFGGIGATVHGVKFKEMADKVDMMMSNKPIKENMDLKTPSVKQEFENVDRSIGAAQYSETRNIYDEYLVGAGEKPLSKEAFDKSLSEIRGNKFTKANANLLKFLAPNLRAAYSEAPTTRSAIERLVNINLGQEKNNYGLPTAQSVETAVIPHYTPYLSADKVLTEESKKYFSKAKQEGAAPALKNQNDFNLEVSREISGYGQSEIPEVKSAAAAYKRAFEKTGKDLQEMGFKIGSNPNYKPRDYNQRAIKQNTPNFKSIIQEGLNQNLIPAIKSGFQKRELDVFSDLNQHNTRIAELESFINKIADQKFQEAQNNKLDKRNIIKTGDYKSVGPASIKLTSIKDLSEKDFVYRETSGERLGELLREERGEGYSKMFVADEEHLALGQGNNKGVIIKFYSNKLSGARNQKLSDVLSGAAREYTTNWKMPNAIKEIKFKKDLKVKKIFNDQLDKDFSKKENGNNIIYERKESKNNEDEPQSKISNEELSDLLDKYKEARKILTSVKPKSLFQFIKENGGIYDQGGELSGRGISNKTLIGLVRKTKSFEKRDLNGVHRINVTFDDVALRAWEADYFPHLSERPTINDLLDAIDSEISGKKVYSENDLEKVQLRDYANDIFEQLNQLGIDVEKIKEAKRLEKGKVTKKEEITKITPISFFESKISIKNKTKVSELLVKKEIEGLKAKVKRIEERYKESVTDYKTKFSDPVDVKAFVQDATDQITDNILGNKLIDPNIAKYLTRTPNSSLKRRSLWFIPDQKLEGFIDNDIKDLAHNYIRKTAADIEIRRNFPTDDINLTQTLKNIEEEYSAKINDVDNQKLDAKAREKEKSRLQAKMKDDVNILATMRDVLRGNYQDNNLFTGADTAIGQGLYYTRQLNYLSKMGGVTISSLNDPARIILEHGSKAFAKNINVLTGNLPGFKLGVNEAKLAGNVAEIASNSNIKTMSELLNDGANKSQAAKTIRKISGKFTTLTGMPIWNDFWHAFTSISSQRNILDYSLKWANNSISEKEKLYLTRLGIGQDESRQIAKEADKFDIQNNGDLWIANSEIWKNQEAVRTFRNALNKDINSIVYVRGIGEVPLFMNTNLGKTVMQFKSFALAGIQQSYLRALQKNDIAAWSGITSSIAIGMMIYYLKALGKGNEPDLSPVNLIKEGVDRSSVFGVLSDFTQLTTNATGLTKPTSRYQSRNATGQFLGPSFGTYQDLFTLSSLPIRELQGKNMSKADQRAMINNLPFANLFYINYLYNNIDKK